MCASPICRFKEEQRDESLIVYVLSCLGDWWSPDIYTFLIKSIVLLALL